MKKYLILAATAGALSFGLVGGASAAPAGSALDGVTVGGKSAVEAVARRRVCTTTFRRGTRVQRCRWVGGGRGWRRGRGRGGRGITIRVR